MLEKEQGKSIQTKTNMLDRSHTVWASPPSESCLGLANTPGDYSGLGDFLSSSPCQQMGPESSLLILPRPGERRKPSDPDLSTNSDDQESGIADFSSPPSEDSAKDPDEAAYSAAWAVVTLMLSEGREVHFNGQLRNGYYKLTNCWEWLVSEMTSVSDLYVCYLCRVFTFHVVYGIPYLRRNEWISSEALQLNKIFNVIYLCKCVIW